FRRAGRAPASPAKPVGGRVTAARTPRRPRSLTPAISSGSTGWILTTRADPGLAGDLWGDFILGKPAGAGDRDPHGARRLDGSRAGASHRAGVLWGGRRNTTGRGRSLGAGPVAAVATVRNRTHRSNHVPGDCNPALVDCRRGRLSTRPPRLQDRSD